MTFWGARWARANALSGSRASSSFKGYANNLSVLPPVGGITWTSDPGTARIRQRPYRLTWECWSRARSIKATNYLVTAKLTALDVPLEVGNTDTL